MVSPGLEERVLISEPAFFRHFYDMNELIKQGVEEGVPLTLNSLGIGNGIIDAATQFPFVWLRPTCLRFDRSDSLSIRNLQLRIRMESRLSIRRVSSPFMLLSKDRD